MPLIDRHIAIRYLWNVAVVFSLLFTFAVTIDVIVQLDRFVEAADAAVDRGERAGRLTALPLAIFDFHGPRLFQFYAYLLGLVTVAAMGFTLVQMARARELVALLTAGMSLQRVARPILLVTLLLNLGQLINAELILPRLAPLLVREHGEILAAGLRGFPMPLTRDGSGMLILADRYEPATETLIGVLALERDARGRAIRRISATEAVWDRSQRAWILSDGVAMRAAGRPQPVAGADAVSDAALAKEPVEILESDLDPRSITIRRSATFAQMLSMSQLQEVARAGVVEQEVVARAWWGRFAGIAANLVVFLLALPSFLLREPANLLLRSVECAAVAVGAFLLVLVGLTISLPGVPVGFSMFAPQLVLLPLALGRLSIVRT
jgi:lipopolysaccharide export LptBFGC system permease protein LptF